MHENISNNDNKVRFIIFLLILNIYKLTHVARDKLTYFIVLFILSHSQIV